MFVKIVVVEVGPNMFAKQSSSSGGRAQILCSKLFIQWFVRSRLEVDTWQAANSIFIRIDVCVYVLKESNCFTFFSKITLL